MATHPWDIYAEQMYTHGYGYPLWTPDPAPGASEVMIGDVGWLDEGAFHTLFNALKGLEEPQPRGDAPVDYLPLERDKAVIDGPRETISQPALFGRSIRDVTAGASVSTGGTISTPSVGLSIHFECRDDYGAVLLLHPLGVSHAIKSHNLISRYMRQHFERWLEFANSRFELGLKDEELIFVCGTIKTSRWGVAAFHGDYREKSGSITGNMSSLASVDFSLRVADAQLQSAYYRAGPPRYRLGPAMPMAISEGEVAGAGTAGDQDKADQCIFVHYYKMKRRMFVLQFPIRAAASPRDLSEDHEDDVPGSTSWCDAIVVDESGDLGEGEHRQHSESQYALASSLDIKRLFGILTCGRRKTCTPSWYDSDRLSTSMSMELAS
ncbi:hypothetical protein OH76DRAFT_262270 [Lentinus brumalis]|uniref:Uncharacterized protein n=1 Tax=Lentinus brumalis TaxID=2498619 RepID=A0A371DGM9_9APHY|nr:hypothetical protein OH76DRAFT_262270 [Polyporus brumalis]